MQKLEQIESFGAFLDFLSNPKEYEQLVKDVRQAAKDYKELVEKKRKIKDIDAWRASEGARLGKIVDEVNRKEDLHLKSLADLAESVNAHKKSVSDANKRLRERESLVSSREDAVSDLEKRADKIKRVEAEYSTKLSDLRAEKDRLKVQASKIQAAAGGL